MGKVTLILAIPMAILIALQFYSPQSAWVNRGVGGDMEGAGFSGAMGFARPPGTFSFTNGLTLFFSFVAPFVLYFWLDKKPISKFILFAATASLLLAIPISISRTLLFQVLITVMFTMVAITRKPEYMGKMVLAAVGGFIALAILNQSSFFATAIEAFTSRFESANTSEGGLDGVFLDRFLGGLIGAIIGTTDLPFWGYGLGMGTNVGSMLLTGKTTFLIAEGEWGRVVGELGPLMGIGVILLRLGLVLKIASASYKWLAGGDILPWLLLSFGFITLLQSQWAQPTSLGFSTLIGGLMLASFRSKEEIPAPEEAEKINSY